MFMFYDVFSMLPIQLILEYTTDFLFLITGQNWANKM